MNVVIKLTDMQSGALKFIATTPTETVDTVTRNDDSAVIFEGKGYSTVSIRVLAEKGLIVLIGKRFNPNSKVAKLTDAGREYAIAQGWIAAPVIAADDSAQPNTQDKRADNGEQQAPAVVGYVPQVGDVVEHLYSSVVGTVVVANHDKYIYAVDFGNGKPNQVLPRELILRTPAATTTEAASVEAVGVIGAPETSILAHLGAKPSLKDSFAGICNHFKKESAQSVETALKNLVANGYVTEFSFAGDYELTEAGYKYIGSPKSQPDATPADSGERGGDNDAYAALNEIIKQHHEAMDAVEYCSPEYDRLGYSQVRYQLMLERRKSTAELAALRSQVSRLEAALEAAEGATSVLRLIHKLNKFSIDNDFGHGYNALLTKVQAMITSYFNQPQKPTEAHDNDNHLPPMFDEMWGDWNK